jgi:hypothetical protein
MTFGGKQEQLLTLPFCVSMAMVHNFAKPILILPHLFSAYSKYDFYE